jgi:uncharacterized protein (TIGR00369 family)
MTSFIARDPNFEAKVRASFERQKIMALLGARLGKVESGLVEIELPFRDDLTQQHGFFHAGVTSTIADSAGGYASFSLFPEDSSVLTVEYKMNLLAPADGERLVATGRVIKPGRTLTVCDLEVTAYKDGRAKLIAKGLQTMMCIQDRPDIGEAG